MERADVSSGSSSVTPRKGTPFSPGDHNDQHACHVRNGPLHHTSGHTAPPAGLACGAIRVSASAPNPSARQDTAAWRVHARESILDVNDGIVSAAGIAEGFAIEPECPPIRCSSPR